MLNGYNMDIWTLPKYKYFGKMEKYWQNFIRYFPSPSLASVWKIGFARNFYLVFCFRYLKS